MKKPDADPWLQYYDWQHASLGDVLSSAAKNFGPSAGADIREAVKPLLPKNWRSDATSALALAKAVGSRYSPGRYFETPQQRARNEAPLDAIAAAYKARYGGAGPLKQSLATDPFGVLMDTSALATIPAGGEGLVSRVPGVLGKTLRATTKAARVVSDATNPIGLAGKAVALPAKAAIRAAQGSILDRTGGLSASAKAAVAKAFPSGIISDAELADPKFKSVLAQTMARKGVTPEAAREAVLRYHDAAPARSAVTGKTPPVAARGAADELNTLARKKLGESAAALSGAPSPSAAAVGSALEDAQIGSHNAMHGLYRQAFSHPGEYDPASLATLPDKLTAELKTHHLPSTPEEFAKYPSFVQSANAFDWLTGHLGKLGETNELTMPNLERTRQELNQFRRAADGTDSRAMSAIIDAFDQHLQDAAAAGQFSGAPEAASDMASAREAFKRHQAEFANHSNPTHASIAQAIKNLAPDQSIDAATGLITAPATAGSAEAAQGALSRKLINPRTLESPPGGDKLYERLSDILGGAGSPGEQALKDHIRQTALASDDGGVLASGPKLKNFLDGPLASKVYDPEELSKIRLLSAADDVLSARPKGGLDLTLKDAVGHSVRQGMGALIGAGASHVIGVSPELGGVVGTVAEQPLESLRGTLQRSAERSGAKPNMGLARKIEAAGNLAGTTGKLALAPYEEQELKVAQQPEPPPTAAPALESSPKPAAVPEPKDDENFDWTAYADPPEQPEAREGRKAGGRVDDDVERLVRSLLRRTQHAKTQANRSTEPLLKTPDDAVAKALSVAQQAI